MANALSISVKDSSGLAKTVSTLDALLALMAPATGTPASVTSAAASTVLLAANTARKGSTIFNESTALLYVLLGSGTASATSYTVQIRAGDYYEVPFGYQGAIKGIWAAANGFARVTELT